MNKLIILLLLMINGHALSGDSQGTGGAPTSNAAPQHHILCTAPSSAIILQNQADDSTSPAEASARCVNVLQMEGTQGQVIQGAGDETGDE